jgi:hypothetical protein
MIQFMAHVIRVFSTSPVKVIPSYKRGGLHHGCRCHDPQSIARSALFRLLAEVRLAFPDISVPDPLPAGSRLTTAVWEYPPVVVVSSGQNQPAVDHLEYNIAPKLTRGIVQLGFQAAIGFFLVTQGQFAYLNPAKIKTLGNPTQRRLPRGRDVWVNDIQSPSAPRGHIRVLGWVDTATLIKVSISSDVLSIDQLATIADTMLM